MDTSQVTWLKDEIAAAAGDFDTTLNEPATYTVTDASAFGNTASAGDYRAAWDAAVGKALTAATALSGALWRDVDRLGQVIESFLRWDDETADRINALRTRMTFISSHVQSNGDRFPDRWNDFLRAQQLDRLVNHAAGVEGPVVIGGDDNVTLIEDEQHEFDLRAPEALERFEDVGYQEVGDVSDQGGTLNGRSIDHIHARGVTAGEPSLVDGGPSDHDGQAVTYTVSDW